MLVTVHAFSSLRSGMTCAKHTNGSSRRSAKIMIQRAKHEIARLVISGRWKSKHLISAAEQFGSEYVGDALLSVITEGDPVEGDFHAQNIVGTYLFDLKPKCSAPLLEILRAALPRWNLSVAVFPAYIAELFGREQLLDALRIVEYELTLTDHAKRSIQTFRYWLRDVQT